MNIINSSSLSLILINNNRQGQYIYFYDDKQQTNRKQMSEEIHTTGRAPGIQTLDITVTRIIPETLLRIPRVMPKSSGIPH